MNWGALGYVDELAELEENITKSNIKMFDRRERHVLRHIATGGMWNESELTEIQMGDGICKHCGGQVDSSDHILWNIPEINKHRQHGHLESLDSDVLPEAIKHGIALQMNWKANGSF